MKSIYTELSTKASEGLAKKVEDELKVPDPPKTKAKAVLKGDVDEDSEGDDPKGSDSDNTESS